MTHEDDSDLYGISGTQCGNDEVARPKTKPRFIRVPAGYWRQDSYVEYTWFEPSEYKYAYIP